MSVIIDLLGEAIQPEEFELLTHPKASGVILFQRNIKNFNQLSALVKSIHETNPNLIISVDHEGGYIQRIVRLGFRSLPPARLYGEVYDLNPDTALKLAQQYGHIMADDLLKFGIHLSFAPVLDIHGTNTIIAGLDRAFHKDAEIITKLAGAFIDGMHEAGMPSVGKHFPGHGFCQADSHVSHPIDTRSLEELKASDLVPFTSLIQAKSLDAIMPAHITYPAVDEHFAAGYSSKWLREILRGELGFEGLIISDCLGMTGADIGDLLTRGTQAFTAGCNLVIAANQKRDVLKVFLDAIPNTFEEENQKYIQAFRQKINVQTPRGIKVPQSPTVDSGANPTETI